MTQTTEDLIVRLRSDGENENQHQRQARFELHGLLNEAADEIERLQEKLKETHRKLDDYKFLSIHQQQVLGEYMRKDIS